MSVIMMNIENDTPMEGMPLIQPSSTDHPLYDSIVEACRSQGPR